MIAVFDILGYYGDLQTEIGFGMFWGYLRKNQMLANAEVQIAASVDIPEFKATEVFNAG